LIAPNGLTKSTSALTIVLRLFGRAAFIMHDPSVEAQANLDISLAFWRISRETIFAVPFDALAGGGQTRAGA